MTRSIERANHLAERKIGLAGDVFGELLDSLSGKKKFDLNKLYELNHADFSLAMELIADWRLHRYCYEIKAANLIIKQNKAISVHAH
jgi:hypothetical protein